MDWLWIVCALIATFLWGMVLIESFRFIKELKELNEDEVITNFAERWIDKSSKGNFLIIIAIIFSLVAIFLKK